MEHSPIQRLYGLLVITTIITITSACSSYKKLSSTQTYPAAPNYTTATAWAALPWVKNPTDSVSAAFTSSDTTPLADVFFIHPTTYLQKKFTTWNANVLDSHLNHRTDNSTLLYQATAFKNRTRIFAPRYRQVHLQGYYAPDSLVPPAFDTAYADVARAFQHYLTEWNNGKPIIIAAHSQGTQHAARLLKQYFDHPGKTQLVVAYLPGMPIPDTFFQYLPVCTSPSGVGCVTSWRTYKTGYIEPKFVARETFKAIVVNPLSWRTAPNEWIPYQQNPGSILKNFQRKHTGVAGAVIHGNVLWTNRPRFFGSFLLRTKNYHIGDINLFYESIRNNVLLRIQHYLQPSALTQ